MRRITMHALAMEQFDRHASLYNELWLAWSKDTLRSIIELANPEPNWRVLDIATGTGFTALALAPLVERVIGLDVSPKMLEEAARRAAASDIHNVEWVEAAAEALPFPDGYFDLVTVRIAPHHFTDVSKFLRETWRVLRNPAGGRPSGVFVMADTSVPDEDPEAALWQNLVEKERDPSHVANFSPTTWRRVAESAGLVITDLLYSNGRGTIPLTKWLDLVGCEGERAEKVRSMFASVPDAARQHFHITQNPEGETEFSWARVVLRGVRPSESIDPPAVTKECRPERNPGSGHL
jgi:ubiquinone/menaquinone biosynthesis C-methylase UbiE